MKKAISIFFALLMAASGGAIVLSYAPADTAAAATRLNFDGGAPRPRRTAKRVARRARRRARRNG